MKKQVQQLLIALALITGSQITAQPNVSFTNLYSFGAVNSNPRPNNLILGRDGNFYGTTFQGGDNGTGSVFRITASGSYSNLYSFSGNDGYWPLTGVIQGSDGYLYGTTSFGGIWNSPTLQPGVSVGTVFKMNTNGGLVWTYSFVTDSNNQFLQGEVPKGPLIEGKDGNFYATTSDGGFTPPNIWPASAGTVFEITQDGLLTTLFTFASTDLVSIGNSDLTPFPNGEVPIGGLTQDSNGNLYGTTGYGGPYAGNYGTIFKLSPTGTLVWSIPFDGTNGSYPTAGLTQGRDGNFYGTTAGTTAGDFPVHGGTIFKVTPAGVFSLLYSFSNDYPVGPLVLGNDGNFYGCTSRGGANGSGTVFQITPDGNLLTLISLPLGTQPTGLTLGNDGYFYGTGQGGGTYDAGTFFRLSPASPSLQPSGLMNNALTFSWGTAPGWRYQLQFTTSLPPATWLNLGGVITATNSTTSTSAPIGSDTKRFYRVQVLQ